jgi:hypothetical protein
MVSRILGAVLLRVRCWCRRRYRQDNDACSPRWGTTSTPRENGLTCERYPCIRNGQPRCCIDWPICRTISGSRAQIERKAIPSPFRLPFERYSAGAERTCFLTDGMLIKRQVERQAGDYDENFQSPLSASFQKQCKTGVLWKAEVDFRFRMLSFTPWKCVSNLRMQLSRPH